jgi:aerobic-type carbon monoxide dehydrogenase small subunit (CoxS/CutS family)
MAADAEDADIVTVEGLTSNEYLTPVQQAFAEAGAVQCGCTPGLVVATTALLETNPRPSEDDVRDALVGNLCRCIGYGAIARAVASSGCASRVSARSPAITSASAQPRP